jgi:hypothetical protein
LVTVVRGVERPTLEADAKQELQRLLESPTLRGSRRSQLLLRYVVERALAGDLENLKERMIGIQLFGRDAGYDTTQDSIVRVAANDLRKRLAEHYSKNPAMPVRISLTPGSYVPVFQWCGVDPPPAPVVPTPATEPTPIIRDTEPGLPTWLRIAIPAFLLGCLATFLISAARTPASAAPADAAANWTPALHQIWDPLVADQTPLLVAFETTENGDIYGLFDIGRLLGVRKPALSIKRFAEVSAEDLSSNHILLLGEEDADPKIRQIVSRGVFAYVNNHIQVAHPRSGEPAEYDENYALISMLPGASAGKRLLALTASEPDQLRAVADYLTTATTADELASHLRMSDGRLPNFYQVVVKSPIRPRGPTQYVTHQEWIGQ